MANTKPRKKHAAHNSRIFVGVVTFLAFIFGTLNLARTAYLEKATAAANSTAAGIASTPPANQRSSDGDDDNGFFSFHRDDDSDDGSNSYTNQAPQAQPSQTWSATPAAPSNTYTPPQVRSSAS